MTDKIRVRISGTVRSSFSTEIEMTQAKFDEIDKLLDSNDREARESIFDLVGPEELLSCARVDDIDEFDAV